MEEQSDGFTWVDWALVAIALLLLACTCRGSEPPAAADVTEEGHRETVRRGNHREDLGAAEEGPEAYSIGALSPPEDDSDRWWICVVTRKSDPKSAAASAKLVADFDSSIDLRAWADKDNPELSWAHYCERDIDDPKQADWFRSIRSQLLDNEFPAVVLQPPANGSYGKNARTVGIIHGYNSVPQYMSDRIRAKIKAYSDDFSKRKFAAAAKAAAPSMGHSQAAPVKPPLSRHPNEWPDVAPPKPQALSYKRVRELCPQAPTAWVRACVKDGIADEDELAEAYDELLEGQVNLNHPTQPTSSSLWDLVLVVGTIGCIPACLILWYQLRKNSSMSGSGGNASGSNSSEIDGSSTSNTQACSVPFSPRPGGY